MSKEEDISKMEILTEQWKNGTLEDGYYYVKNKHFLGGETEYYHVFPSGVKYWGGCDDEDIEEILAPVPSYDHFVELTEKANQFSQLVKKVDEVDEKFRFMKKHNKLSKDEETALKSIIFANELETKCNRLEQKNSELVQKIHILNEANMNLENTIGKLVEQLNIAVRVLREYADENSWVDCKTVDDDFEYIERKCSWYTDGYETAQKALKEIDEVLK